MRAWIAEFIIRLVAVLPLPVSYAFATLIGSVIYALPNHLKRPLRINIDLCFPELPQHQRNALYRSCFIETSRAAFETGALWVWDKTRTLALVKQVSGLESLESAFARGKGVILALPHMGAWELIGLYCANRYPTTSLYRPLRLDKLNPFIKSARQRSGATLVPTSPSGIRKIYKSLGNNALVAILPDQDPGREGSVFAPFFGTPASTMTLVPKLLQKTAATLVYGYAERLAHGAGYHIHFLPDPASSWDLDMTQAAAQLNAGVEHCVRQLPAQYQWAYKRFKTRPEGEPPLY